MTDKVKQETQSFEESSLEETPVLRVEIKAPGKPYVYDEAYETQIKPLKQLQETHEVVDLTGELNNDK